MKSCKKLDLDQELLSILKEHFEEKIFQVDQKVVYRGHTPTVGLLLLDGIIEAENTRSKLKYDKGTVIGVKELLTGDPIKYSIKIKSGSKVILLDRSSLLDLAKSKKQSDQKIVSVIS